MVFSTPLVTLYHIGAFTADAIEQIAIIMAVALPFCRVNAYLNKIFSSIRRMGSSRSSTLRRGGGQRHAEAA
ncbi:MAG: hypothetical protein ACLUYK_01775 [Eggerthella lenta]